MGRSGPAGPRHRWHLRHPPLDGYSGCGAISEKTEASQTHLPPSRHPDVGRDDAGALRVSIQGSSAYIKVADGCRRPCAFCAIPLIKGTAVSRPVEAIMQEARTLQDMGIHEIILIAQDTTDYGHDLGIKDGLASLLEE